MSSPSVLIVDDDRGQAESLRRILALEGFIARASYSPEDAIEEVATRVPDAVVSDLRMGSMTGLDLYLKLKEQNPALLFILVTGYGTLETAVEALKAGVHDFLAKPIDTDELIIKLKKALSFRHLAKENVELKKAIARLSSEFPIIAESRLMQGVMETVERVSGSVATVLIQGESGTGKELVARAIHLRSPRATGPYVKVNCAAIPENLIESELFGHEAGAFTGAVARRVGRFESASGGTIFLDEIGEVPVHLQPKLLRVLQEREIERVGGEKTIPIDVRVVAATNRDLAGMVRQQAFREDLFYRLNVIPIQVAPLRERIDDIVPLAQHFLAKYSERNGRNLGSLSEAAKAKLVSYGWPGNVRELENCIERAVVLAMEDHLEPSDFVIQGESPATGVENVLELLLSGNIGLDELERRLLLMALERCEGNVSLTARKLGMTRRSLQYRIEKIRSGDTSDG
ncbi:MAG: sigma-54-dependent Fis family transcriptional regulator [Planctomycetes bacterium]|nr:sigma-54-dependent Fis family transcriptional regulator [Planctomycetota bacterium]